MLVKTNPDAKPRYNGMSLFINAEDAGIHGRPQIAEAEAIRRLILRS